MADLNTTETSEVTVASFDGGNKLLVNADGSINVNSGAPTPSIATPVVQNVFGNVSSTTGVDTFYVVPNLTTLTIQRFSGGAEPHSSGTVVELYYDPNGDSSVLTRVETVFVNGASGQVDVNQDFVGNGTRRIIMRRRVYASAAREVWGRWKGYIV